VSEVVGMKPEMCHVKGGVVTEITVIWYHKDKGFKGFRYVICDPLFYETCEKYIEKLKLKGVDFIKLNNETEKEQLQKIMAECEEAREVVYS
jgi:hypothetical protein